MNMRQSMEAANAEGQLWRRAAAGDRDAFAAATMRYRRELEVHSYRMLGSLDEAEDLVQETLLRAWRRRETYAGRSTLRAWLYGIATNACLDALERRSQRLLPYAAGPPSDPFATPPPASDTPWLEPYPDRLLDELVDEQPELADTVAANETIELAFLVAIQQLPPRQRAVLILRDVVGWSARETAELLGGTVISTKSALQRARETLKEHLSKQPDDWTRSESDAAQQQLLARYMDAWHRADVDGLAALLAQDARFAMPPTPAWYDGREAIRAFLATTPMAPSAPRHLHVPTAANRQPAFAVYTSGETGIHPIALEVLRIENGLIATIDVFREPRHLERFAVAAPA
jgi:RNA polymerase sigma-70 factor (ECF subfamily)